MRATKKPAGANGGPVRRLRAATNPSRIHSTTRARGSQVHACDKVVGSVRGDTFHKTVRGSVHMLRKPQGWALDVGSLLEAERLGARWVEVHDRETGQTYRASIEQIRRDGILFNRGHGDQLCLELARWSTSRWEQPSLFAREDAA